MKYSQLFIVLLVILIMSGCVPQQRLKPIDRSYSEYRSFMNLFLFELPQGEEWYEMGTKGGTTAFGKKLDSSEHTFIASAHISKFTIKFNSPEEFLSFVKESRMKGTPPSEFTIIRYNEILDNTHSNYCTKFLLEAEQKGKGILESHGYSCLHPKHPEIGITIEYSERTQDVKVSEKIRAEGQRFINSLELGN